MPLFKITIIIAVIASIIVFIAISFFLETGQTLKKVVTKSRLQPPTSNISFDDITIRGWLPYWRQNEIESTFYNLPSSLEVSPFYLTLTKEGAISSEKKIRLPEGYTTIPTISNEFEHERVAKILETSQTIDAHIQDIISYTIEDNVPGIEIDYENIPREYRESFTQFILKLGERLHQENKLLYVALQAKTSELKVAAGAESQDYKAICEIADKCTIMAYDKHWKGSGPGPITPISWLKEVIAYAQTEIPNEKLVIGLPLYGYEWPTNQPGFSRTHDNILQYSSENQYNILFDNHEKTPYINTGTSQLWFDNEESLHAKMYYARSKGIQHFAFWALGGEGELLRNLLKKISY